MTSLSHDSAVSKALLSHDSALSLTSLSQNWVVTSRQHLWVSQWKLSFVYDLDPWRRSVSDTAESKLSNVIITAESKLKWRNWHRWVKTQQCHWHHWVSKDTAESIFEFLRLSFPLMRQSNQIQARVIFTTRGLWGKSLKNWGCLKKLFWLRGVIDTAESALNLSISANLKFYVIKTVGCDPVT